MTRNWYFTRAVRLALRLLFLVALCAVPMVGAQTNDAFALGLELSRVGEYPEAVTAFADEAKARPATGTLLNLGLAEWNRGHAGAAILAWEQARWIDPFDARAAANLRFARQVTEVDAPELRWYERASTWLPPDAWVWIAGASLWLALGVLVLPRVARQKREGWHQTVAAVGLCAFLFSVTANLGVVSRTDLGYVIKKTTPLLLTPTRDGEVISTLSGGEPARRLRTRGDYFFIRTSNAAGWVERTDFGLVCTETKR